MFWTGCGPQMPDTAVACSVAHDSHNVWVIGSCDEAMAAAVNRLQEIDGGWVLVHRGKLAGEVRYEVAGLMTNGAQRTSTPTCRRFMQPPKRSPGCTSRRRAGIPASPSA